MFQPVDVDSSASKGVIAPETSMGMVRLRVHDLAGTRTFYERVLGMVGREQPGGSVQLGVIGNPDSLLELIEDQGAEPNDVRRPGLFHVALLLPSRVELAAILLRLIRHQWPLQGASDHLVSEALYLADPEGNGIEIYWDREREDWRRGENGELAMATLPLNLDELLGLLDPTWASVSPRKLLPLPEKTRVGHVHLQVSDISQTDAFYTGVLGFEPQVRSYPGALFVSAGGYHHHVGLNTWNSRQGGPARPEGLGLVDYEIRLGSEQGLDELLLRLSAAGIATETLADGRQQVRDPDGIGIVLRV